MTSSPLPDDSTPDTTTVNRLAWAQLASLALVAAVAGPFFLGRVYSHDDLAAYHLPTRLFYAGALEAGEPFDWMPQLFGGYHLTGEGQAGTYHPWHLLLYSLLPFRAAFCLEILASYAFALVGGYLFLRRVVPRREAAWWGATAFAFSGTLLLRLAHMNAVAVVAHLPWLLLCIDLLVKGDPTQRRRAMAGLALLTGSQLLLGYPQYVWYTGLVELVYLAFLLQEPNSLGGVVRSQRWPRATIVCLFTLATFLGVLLGAVQLLPTFESLQLATRVSADASFASWGSLHPLNLVQLIAPYTFRTRVVGQNTHELGLYCGAVPLVLAVLCLIRRPQTATQLRRAFVALGLLGLLLALGEFGPLHTVVSRLPLVSSFRFPCRASVILTWSICGLATLGLADLLTRRGSNEATTLHRPFGWLVGLSVFVWIAAWVFCPREHLALCTEGLAGPLLIAAAAGIVLACQQNRRWAWSALVLFTALDLGVYGLSYRAWSESTTANELIASSELPFDLGSARVLADAAPADTPRTGAAALRTGNQMILAGAHRWDGYAGLFPARTLDYRSPAALELARVAWVREAPSEDDPPLSHAWRQPAASPLDRFRLVGHAIASADPAQEIAAIDIHTTALVPAGADLPPLDPSAAGTVTVVSDRPGRIELLTESHGRKLLVISESHHPGWQATLNGEPTKVLRTNGDFLGCLVGPGAARVVLEFAPQSLAWGRWLTFAGALGTVLCLLGRWRSAVRPATGTSVTTVRS